MYFKPSRKDPDFLLLPLCSVLVRLKICHLNRLEFGCSFSFSTQFRVQSICVMPLVELSLSCTRTLKVLGIFFVLLRQNYKLGLISEQILAKSLSTSLPTHCQKSAFTFFLINLFQILLDSFLSIVCSQEFPQFIKMCLKIHYKLIIFRKSILLTILLKTFSTQQYCECKISVQIL